MAHKIKLSELRRLVNKVVNESKLQNEYHYFFDVEDQDNESNKENSFNSEYQDMGKGTSFKTCKNGFEWKIRLDKMAGQKNMKMTLSNFDDVGLLFLMDGDEPKAVALIDWIKTEIKMVRAKQNAKIEVNSELGECVEELGATLGRIKATNLLRKGGM